MDFFAAQESARRRTGLLVALFVAAVAAIIVVVYAVAHVAIGPRTGGVDPQLAAIVTFGVLAVVGLGSLTRTASLRRGGPAVAELLGGRRISPDTSDLDERRLLNVVEEMSLASGVPVPAVYVVDAEDGINAFAAGYSPHDAAVAVTRGALRALTRDELQGVIAHEFSHILNGDMRLNIRLIGVLYGILLLAVIGRGILHFGPRGGRRRGGDQGGAGIALIALALLVVGYVGVFFGRLIKAAVSRQREYLADSAAVEFTRNPDGLAGALKKIAAADTGSRIVNHHAEELSHLFFANGLRSGLLGFLATHPPIDERIRRLDPHWDGTLVPLKLARTDGDLPGGSMLAGSMAAGGATSGLAPSGAPGGAAFGPSELAGTAPTAQGATAQLSGEPGGSAASTERWPAMEPAGTLANGAFAPAAVVASAGSPTPRHLEYAAALLRTLPEELNRAVREAESAPAVVFALLIASNEGDGEAELAAILRDGDAHALGDRIRRLVPLIRQLGPRARLPLLDLLLPSLRTLSPAEAEWLLDAVDRAVHADRRVKLFELTLLNMLRRTLSWPDASDRAAFHHHSFANLTDEVGALLSALAWAGSGHDEAAARDAFTAAIRRLPPDVAEPRFAPRDDVSVGTVARALDAFQHASPDVRRRLLEACALCASHDGRIGVSEGELLRAISEALDCPIPPLV